MYLRRVNGSREKLEENMFAERKLLGTTILFIRETSLGSVERWTMDYVAVHVTMWHFND